MDGEKHTAIASLAPDLFCVSMNGLSKSHRIAGFRVGWMVLSGPKYHVKDYIEGLNMLSICVCAQTSYLSMWYKRRLVVINQLMNCCFLVGAFMSNETLFTRLSMKFQACQQPNLKRGSIYFPKIDREMYRVDDDEQFVLDFLKQEKILLVHGRGFNWKRSRSFPDCLSTSCR